MQGHNAYGRRGGHIWKQDRRGVKASVEARGIRLATLEIRLGRAGGLKAALRALKHGNADVGVLQEMNLRDGIHAQQGAGYAVLLKEADIRHQGGDIGSLEGRH